MASERYELNPTPSILSELCRNDLLLAIEYIKKLNK